jgi:hypothetical protein
VVDESQTPTTGELGMLVQFPYELKSA